MLTLRSPLPTSFALTPNRSLALSAAAYNVAGAVLCAKDRAALSRLYSALRTRLACTRPAIEREELSDLIGALCMLAMLPALPIIFAYEALSSAVRKVRDVSRTYALQTAAVDSRRSAMLAYSAHLATLPMYSLEELDAEPVIDLDPVETSFTLPPNVIIVDGRNPSPLDVGSLTVENAPALFVYATDHCAQFCYQSSAAYLSPSIAPVTIDPAPAMAPAATHKARRTVKASKDTATVAAAANDVTEGKATKISVGTNGIVIKDVATLPYRTLQAECKRRLIKATGTAEEMRARLIEHNRRAD